MPTEEKIVKKISIGDDSRYIAAKYDLDGEEITTTYAKADNVVTKQNIIDGKITQPCDVFVVERKSDRTVLNFIIHEGRNRQIRKMCDAVGLEVLRLKRIEIAGVKLGGLKPGSWRDLNERELTRLNNISKPKDEDL